MITNLYKRYIFCEITTTEMVKKKKPMTMQEDARWVEQREL